MFERLGSWTYRFRFLMLMAWAVAAVGCAMFAPSLAGSGSTDQTSFLPAGAPSVQARDALEAAFPGSTSSSSATITLARPGGVTDADRAYRDEVAAWVTGPDAPAELRAAVTSTETAASRPELSAMLRSPDGELELLVVNVNVATAGDEAALVVDQLREHLAATTPPGLDTHVTGAAAISSDYLAAIKAGTASTTAVTIALVVVVLLLIYRAPLAALVPLLTIGGAFLVARGVLGLLAAAGWQVSSLLDTFLVVLVFGVGTDYTIFLISRYREQVSGGGDWHGAARSTVKRIGAVITASAATVIVGLGSMACGDFAMISSTGPALAVSIFVTLLAGLTLAPALLSIFGHYLFWPLHTRTHGQGEPGGFFARLAAAVSRRPGVVTVALLIALLLPATYLPRLRTNFDLLTELPATSDSRLGYEAVATHLGEDKLVQSTGIVGGGGTDVLAPASLARLRDLMVELRRTPGVATVTSIVSPDGDAVVPDGFRPSAQLGTMADGFAGDSSGGTTGESGSLLDAGVSDGLAKAAAYVDGLAVSYPDVAAGAELRAVQGGLGDAQRLVDRVRAQSVLSTQLRTLGASVTSPANAAASTGGGSGGSGATMLRDYLGELAAAYPEVRSLPAWKDAVRAATSLQREPSASGAVDLGAALDKLADHFDGRPDATLSPKALANTPGAKEVRAEATRIFDALPSQLRALSSVFAARSDDIWIPTTLSGDDAAKLNDAVDAFVSSDHAATRFYLTSSNDPYSGDAFGVVRAVQGVVADRAAGFGPRVTGHVGGPTAQFADVQSTLASDFNRVGVMTVAGILLVLVVLLRAIVAPLYLVGTVLVSYASAVGLSGFLFQEVLGQPGVSFYLPLMVFVLLVALGSDYNIFLMHRVREESEHRPLRDGVRIASGRTGAVITSAGLILAGTFGSMATAPLTVLFQVGVAVAIGVLIDTFVVRSILVPAITTLVGDRAWWPSRATLAGVIDRVPLVPVATAAPAPADLRRSRLRLAVAVGLVVLVPVLVASLLTWSFSSRDLGSVRAAVVDLDEGGTAAGAGGAAQQLALGHDLVATLTAPGGGGGLAWTATDGRAASAGLADGSYAAALTIPADFSRSVAAIRGDTTGRAPKATLQVATEDGSGYTLGSVAQAVTAAIGSSTADEVTASYVDDVLVRMTAAHDALASGAADAQRVADDGTSLAGDASGTGAVAGQLTSGLRELAAGAGRASSGSGQLVAGIRTLADGGASLATGASELSSGTTKAAHAADQLSAGATKLATGAATLADQTAGLPGQVSALAAGADGVKAGTAGIAAGAEQAATALTTMASRTAGLGDRATALNAGAAGVDSGAAALSATAAKAADGAGSVAEDAAALAGKAGNHAADLAALAASCPSMGGDEAVCSQLAGLADQAAGVGTAAGVLAAQAGGVRQLVAGVADGAAGVAQGADTVHEGAHALAATAPGLEDGIAKAASGATALATQAGLVAGGATRVADGADQLAASAPALAGGVSSLASGAATLAKGQASFAAGMDRLASGASALASGSAKSAAGTRKLADGASSAAGGVGQLTDAVRQAADAAALIEAQVNGIAEDGSALAGHAGSLATGLDAGADDTTSYPAETRDRMGDLAADPVAVDTTRVNAIGGPQGGLAPFFMAIAAWLGALGAFLVLPAVWPRDDRRWWLGVLRSFASASAVSVAGALLMVGGLLLLGVHPANAGELAAFAVLGALAFTAIVQALVALFGNRGWLAAMLLLVVSVAASGYPPGAAAATGPLGALRPFLPLTYALDGARGAITASGSVPAIDAVVLVAWLVVGVLVALAAAAAADRAPVREVSPAGA